MLSFLKYFLASLVALIVFFAFLILILVGIGVSSASSQEIINKPKSILKLDLNREIVERAMDNPFSGFDVPGFDEDLPIGLDQVRLALKYAAIDENIQGIYLPLTNIQAGYATHMEIRQALEKFREKSGKPIWVYSNAMTESAYYVASVADSILLNPMGLIEFNGLYAERVFFPGFLKKIGVEPVIFRVGTFKSAVEPFINEEMSEASELQTKAYTESVYSHYLETVSTSRYIDKTKLREIADSLKVRNAKDALSFGLVDVLSYKSDLAELFKNLTDVDEEEDIPLVSLSKYLKSEKPDLEKGDRKKRIAIIIGEGEIVSGSNRENGRIKGGFYASQIRKAREDSAVKAIVLRINSPGGSVLGSDVIWNEVIKTRKVKPVIASMSDVAASGGYYMAMACDTIVAAPTTITGSIGVFALLFNVKELLNEKLGVYSDGYGTGPYSDFPNLTEPFDEKEKDIIQTEIDRIYIDFITKVGKGRNMDTAAVNEIAQGRVWTGLQAREIGLVDVLGGLDTAISIAAANAGIADDYRIKFYPEKQDFLKQLIKEFSRNTAMAQLDKDFGGLLKYYEKAKSWKELEGYNARVPYDLEIK